MSRHRGVLAVAALGLGLTAVPPLDPPFLIWNASASVPIGLYAIERPTQLRVADLIAVAPPEPLANFLADRGYLPRGVPLLKHVQALSGQSVCRNGFAVTIDGAAIARRASAIAAAVRFPPGRAATSSARTKSSS